MSLGKINMEHQLTDRENTFLLFSVANQENFKTSCEFATQGGALLCGFGGRPENKLWWQDLCLVPPLRLWQELCWQQLVSGSALACCPACWHSLPFQQSGQQARAPPFLHVLLSQQRWMTREENNNPTEIHLFSIYHRKALVATKGLG